MINYYLPGEEEKQMSNEQDQAQERQAAINLMFQRGDTISDVARKFPDLTLSELEARVTEVIDSQGIFRDQRNSDAFKDLVRGTAQKWIDGLYMKAPDVAKRLDSELNPDFQGP